MTEKNYNIIRFYRDGSPAIKIRRDLTLEEAQMHCKSPETSSSTCSTPAAIQHTEKYGEWFDGYEEVI